MSDEDREELFFEDPTNRKHEGAWSVASCKEMDKFSWSEYGGRKLEDVPFEGLVPYFTEHAHPNTPLAVAYLVDKENVKVTCARTVMKRDDAYWRTGREDAESYCQIMDVSGVVLTPAGHLEQILSAGLACIYLNGAQSKPRTEERPHFYSVGYQAPDDLDVYFKFEGQKVIMQLMSERRTGLGFRAIHIAAGSW
jgi:hypothetical protein